jgi:uncharacterized protein (TIGR00369 family)
MESPATGSVTPIDQTKRARKITWDDPAISIAAASEMSGLEFISAIAEGLVPAPPVGHLLGMRPVEVEAGRVVFALDPGEHLYNPVGGVHGGMLSTLLDSAISCAVHTTLPAGGGYTTVELKVNFVRPVTAATGLLRCEGTVIHAGRRIATGEGRVTGPDGKLYAHGTATCMLIGGRE